jgi:peptidoglycan/xylan/chitin deacetylase (PgdA/CDA1 family)
VELTRWARGRARVVRRNLRAAGWWVSSPARRIKDLDPAGVASPTAIALTFDDGPHPEVTPMLLDLLEEYSVPATFFMCGLAAERHPDVVRAVVDRGHSLGGHTWSHRRITELSDAEWPLQIDRTHELLEDFSGSPIRWFRPPQGKSTRATRGRLRESGLWSVRWSTSGRDWSLRDPHQIAEAAKSELGPSGIALFHDAIADYTIGRPDEDHPNQEPTVTATRLVIEWILDRGLTPVGLDVLPPSTMPSVSLPRVFT